VMSNHRAVCLSQVCDACLKVFPLGFTPLMHPGTAHSFCSPQCSDASLSFSRPRRRRPALDPMQPLNDMCAERGERFPLLIAVLACQLLLDTDGAAQQTLQVRKPCQSVPCSCGRRQRRIRNIPQRIQPCAVAMLRSPVQDCTSSGTRTDAELSVCSQHIMLLAHVRIEKPPRPWLEAYQRMHTCLELWVASLPTADEQERAAARLQELVTPGFFMATMSRLHINSFRWVFVFALLTLRCVAHLLQVLCDSNVSSAQHWQSCMQGGCHLPGQAGRLPGSHGSSSDRRRGGGAFRQRPVFPRQHVQPRLLPFSVGQLS